MIDQDRHFRLRYRSPPVITDWRRQRKIDLPRISSRFFRLFSTCLWCDNYYSAQPLSRLKCLRWNNRVQGRQVRSRQYLGGEVPWRSLDHTHSFTTSLGTSFMTSRLHNSNRFLRQLLALSITDVYRHIKAESSLITARSFMRQVRGRWEIWIEPYLGTLPCRQHWAYRLY